MNMPATRKSALTTMRKTIQFAPIVSMYPMTSAGNCASVMK